MIPTKDTNPRIGVHLRMKTIGIIGAMDEEIIHLKEAMEVVATKSAVGLTFYVGRLTGRNVSLVIARSGIGKVNAAICAQVMVDLFAVDYIINTGVAGALVDTLKVGDILISIDAVQHDMDASALGDPVGTIPRMAESYFKADEEMVRLAQEAGAEIADGYTVVTGRVASGDQFIATKEAKERIRKTVKADCAEMEGAAIAHVCALNRIPFVIIRAISDSANDEAGMSFDKFCPIAAKRSADLVGQMLSKI